jgi:hypothetical protein
MNIRRRNKRLEVRRDLGQVILVAYCCVKGNNFVLISEETKLSALYY